jgi:uncharacterized membrane protein
MMRAVALIFGVNGWRRRASIGLVSVVVALGLLATVVSAAAAVPAAVTLDSTAPTLTAASDGGFTAAVGVTNLTDAAIRVSAAPTEADCRLTVGGGIDQSLPPSVQTSVTIGIPQACGVVNSFSFTIRASAANTTLQVLDLQATTGSPPVWSALLSFPVAVVAALVLTLLIWLLSPSRQSFGASLNGLDSSWSFNDSWATNVTAASGLVVLVVGSSDFLNAVVGPAAQGAIGVATVSGLIALALTGAAGVAVLALKWPSASETTIAGLLAGTFIALGAAGGQIWAVTLALRAVDLGEGNLLKYIGAGLATALLILYAITSVLGLLKQGTTTNVPDPVARPFSDAVVAAAVLAASQDGSPTHEAVTAVLDALAPSEPPPTPKHLRQRSALP